MPKVVAALGRLETRETRTDRGPEHLARTTACRPQDRFELRKRVRNRIPIRTVFREKPETRPDVFNRATDRRTLVTRQVVHDHDVAGRQRRDQDLLDRGQETRAVNRTVKHGRRGETPDAERGQKRGGMPAAVGRVVGDARAVELPPIATHEIRAHATFIEKHETAGIKAGRRRVPRDPRERDVSAIVFRRAYGLF